MTMSNPDPVSTVCEFCGLPDDEDHEVECSNQQWLCGRELVDGARSLTELSNRLMMWHLRLQTNIKEGWQLADTVNGELVHLIRPPRPKPDLQLIS